MDLSLLTHPFAHSFTHLPTHSRMHSSARSLTHITMVRSSLFQLYCQQDRQRPPLMVLMGCAVGKGLSHSPC